MLGILVKLPPLFELSEPSLSELWPLSNTGQVGISPREEGAVELSFGVGGNFYNIFVSDWFLASRYLLELLHREALVGQLVCFFS